MHFPLSLKEGRRKKENEQSAGTENQIKPNKQINKQKNVCICGENRTGEYKRGGINPLGRYQKIKKISREG